MTVQVKIVFRLPMTLIKQGLTYDDTPSAPEYIIFFEPFDFLAGDQLMVPIGVSHIFLRLQKYKEGSGRKRTNEQTNNMLRFTQSAEEELCNIAFPCAYVD